MYVRESLVFSVHDRVRRSDLILLREFSTSSKVLLDSAYASELIYFCNGNRWSCNKFNSSVEKVIVAFFL